MATIAALIGRILLGALFVMAGLGKVMDPAATAAYMEAESPFPGSLTRLASLALLVFTALATLFFHEQVTDQTQAAMALKNVAIIGGLLMVFAYGQVRGQVGLWRERDRAHDAEVKAAHAEGKAEGATAAAVRSDRPADSV
jgi:putative oxidoreductase